VKACEKPLFIAHRGGPDYDTYDYSIIKPADYDIWENSKSAYKRAVNNGAKAIEMDIQLTKDNELIIFHDVNIERTTNLKGKINDYTLEELDNVFTNRTYNETLPTLEWVFNEFQNNVKYIIEVKENKIKEKNEILINRLLKIIRDYKLEKNCDIISFYPRPLTLLKKFNPDINSTLLVYTPRAKSIILMNLAFYLGVETISFNYEGINPKIADECRKSGFKVGVWTVNKKDTLIKLMEEIKPNFITSDFFYNIEQIYNS